MIRLAGHQTYLREKFLAVGMVLQCPENITTAVVPAGWVLDWCSGIRVIKTSIKCQSIIKQCCIIRLQ